MAPPKKREKDATTTTINNGGASTNANNHSHSNNNNNNNSSSSNNGNGGTTAATTNGNGTGVTSVVAATTTVAAAAAATGAPGTANATASAAAAADNSKLNGHQQEQELFLQAFEKPTQIYRYLRNRHDTSPIFLNRTLSYMKDRMSRNNKRRTTFKVNSILDTIIQKSESVANNYLSIIYNGLYDKSTNCDQWWNAGDMVATETTLFKITKSKRKDSTSDFQEILCQNTNVVYNPPHGDQDQYPAVSISMESMQPLGDQHTIYKLLFRIKIMAKYGPNAGDKCDEEDGETPNKRSKQQQQQQQCTKVYGCEMIVFEKNIGLIPEGDYEATLQELSSAAAGLKSFSPKKRSWETLPNNYIPLSLKFDVFNQLPTLKFRLTWSTIELPPSILANELSKYSGFSEASTHGLLLNNGMLGGVGVGVGVGIGIGEGNGNCVANVDKEGNAMHINHNNNCIKTNPPGTRTSAKTEKIQIVYNFLYSNNTRQQTEYTQEVICPWCTLDCLRLYALLKHLKLCHARFNFTYQPAGNGARIDVTINDAYDGSYAGSPYDLAGPSGCSFARTCGPVRRTTVTNLLVCRPRRQKTCLDEFMVLDEDDLSNQRPYITGHNRLYHHTETCLPVHPKELDVDSEGESDPLWLRQKTIQMIDEFTDVNEGEKELMKLWNLHVMKHGYVGDCQLPLACEMFLDAKGAEIIHKNLYRNFILHMCSLFDYGLVSPETVYKVVQKLQGMLSKNSDGQVLMSKQREAQLKYWLDVGMHKEDELKLKSPQKLSANNNNNTGNVNGSNSNGNGTTTGTGNCNTGSTAANVNGTETTTTMAAAAAAVAATSLAGGSANATDAKTMHPPVKRSATAVKRASMHPQGGHNNAAAAATAAADKLSGNNGGNSGHSNNNNNNNNSSNSGNNSATGGGGGASGSNKNVAKKTVIHELSDGIGICGSGSGRERRSIDSNRRNTTTDIKDYRNDGGGRNSLDSNRTLKRKLQTKDGNGGHPAFKRSRSDSHQTHINTIMPFATAAAAAAATNTATATTVLAAAGGATQSAAATTTTTTNTLPKRLSTRRQTITATGSINDTNIHHTTTNTRSSSGKSSAIGNASSSTGNSNAAIATNAHALRTRLYVPLTKADKR